MRRPNLAGLRSDAAANSPDPQPQTGTYHLGMIIGYLGKPAIAGLGLLYSMHRSDAVGIVAAVSVLLILRGLSMIEPRFDEAVDRFLSNLERVKWALCITGGSLGTLCALPFIGNGDHFYILLGKISLLVMLGAGAGLTTCSMIYLIAIRQETFKATVVTGLISTVVILVTIYD